MYINYVDAATGKALTCTPGEFYDVVPVSGDPVPNDGRFIEVKTQESPSRANLPGKEAGPAAKPAELN